MHPRISVSAICTFDWTLEQDLAFYAANHVTNVGVSVAKLERFGWDDGAARLLCPRFSAGARSGVTLLS